LGEENSKRQVLEKVNLIYYITKAVPKSVKTKHLFEYWQIKHVLSPKSFLHLWGRQWLFFQTAK